METRSAIAVEQPPFTRLHGQACWRCGAVSGVLAPAGDVTLDDDDGVWPVVACDTHHGRGMS